VNSKRLDVDVFVPFLFGLPVPGCLQRTYWPCGPIIGHGEIFRVLTLPK